MRRRLDDRAGSLARVAGLEDPGADEQTVGTELHAERRVGRRRYTARREGHHGKLAVLRHPADDLDRCTQLFRLGVELLGAQYELVKDVAAAGKLPVVNFVAGGISTPADAALVMQLGAEGVFVGSGIFKSEDPARMANAIVQATTFFDDPKKIAEVSKGLGAPMRGIALEAIPDEERLAVRGW